MKVGDVVTIDRLMASGTDIQTDRGYTGVGGYSPHRAVIYAMSH